MYEATNLPDHWSLYMSLCTLYKICYIKIYSSSGSCIRGIIKATSVSKYPTVIHTLVQHPKQALILYHNNQICFTANKEHCAPSSLVMMLRFTIKNPIFYRMCTNSPCLDVQIDNF